MAAPLSRIDRIRAKIERAKHHIDELDSRCELFRHSNPYDLVIEFDDQTGLKTFKTKVLSHPPVALSLVIGDVLHNLRSALDHLAWQLVEANGQTPGKFTYFPIYETVAKYKAGSPGQIQGMSAGAISLIDTIQPYQGGNDDLWKLHQLDNFDKHRLLLVAGFGSMSSKLVLKTPASNSAFITFEIPHDSTDAKIFEDGTELGSFSGTFDNQPVIQANLDLTFEIAFGEPQIVRGQPVLPFLHQLSHLVDGIVGQFDPYL